MPILTGLPPLNSDDFARKMLYVLRSRPALNVAFRRAIAAVMAMNVAADRVVEALPGAASPKVLAAAMLAHYRGGCGSKPHPDILLADLIKHQGAFAATYPAAEADLYGGHGYRVTGLTAKAGKPDAASGGAGAAPAEVDRTAEMAHQLLSAFSAGGGNSPIVLHHMGNNSPECVVMGLRVYRELIRQAAAGDEGLLEGVLKHLIFINSSAGGKGTSGNKLDGFVIPKIETLVPVECNADGSLKVPQTIEVPRDANNTLQQFGNPEMLCVEVAADGNATLTCVTGADEQVFKADVPAYLTGGGLFFGDTEARVNEELLRRGLERCLPEFESTLAPAQYAVVQVYTTPPAGSIGYPILREEASFNTGKNCINAAQLLHAHLGAAAFRDAIVLHVQKGEQGIRAATTALAQFIVDAMGPRITAYINPDFTPAIDFMSDEQFIIFAFNLLTEVLVEQMYAMTKDFHHPLPRQPEQFAVAMELVETICHACGEAAADPVADVGGVVDKVSGSSDVTLAQALRLFKLVLWPTIESSLIPREGLHGEIRLRTAMLPWMKSCLARCARASASAAAAGDTLPLITDAVVARRLSAAALAWAEKPAADAAAAVESDELAVE